MRDPLTLERVSEVLDYDPETGSITRRKCHQSKFVGCEAGHAHIKGYRQVRVLGHTVMAHRLAWLFVYGKFPAEQIDHIDGNRSNNAIANLREAAPFQNQRNRRAKGCYRVPKSSKYVAAIKVDGKSIHLGTFENAEQARAAYAAASKKNFGSFSFFNSRSAGPDV